MSSDEGMAAGGQPALEQRLKEFLHRESGPYRSWDRVNRPMIRHWCETMGDSNPVYLSSDRAVQAGLENAIAPPAMMQAWTMKGYGDRWGSGSSEEEPFAVLKLLEEAGYPAIVAVNCEQKYFQYLKEGDEVSFTSSIEEISKQKKTALGTGFFVTQLSRFYCRGKELAGEMRFRVFKYRPHQRPKDTGGSKAPVRRFRPPQSRDTEFFWQGAEAGKLLIQRCRSCKTLRHPPAPMCAKCQALEWDTVQSSGRGTLYSYVIFHHPPIPPFDYPNIIGLVELEEGTRIVSQLAGVQPDKICIGMPLEVFFEEVEKGLTLPLFRPPGGSS